MPKTGAVSGPQPAASVPGAAEILQHATDLAARGPIWGGNPRVGCVLTRDGQVVGTGYHRGAGTAHAEAAAIADARNAGADLRGTTAWVTLEPCNHWGRTAPCSAALLEAGVAEVFYVDADGGEKSRGGAANLAAQGVRVQQLEFAPASELNSWWHRVIGRDTPYVIAKWAATVDGRTAAIDGSSFWITGQEAREHAHQVRAEVDVIVVGSRTVSLDNPKLTARPGGALAAHQPQIVVIGKTDTSAQDIWKNERTRAWTGTLPELLTQLRAEGHVRVLLEGGATLTTSALAGGWVDEVNAYIAPAILGAGTAVVGDLGIDSMSQVLRSKRTQVTQLTPDVLFQMFFY